MRMVVDAPEDQRGRLLQRLFRAYWVENLDVTDKRLLLRLAQEVGITVFGNSEDVFERQSAKDGLRRNTQEGLPFLPFSLLAFFPLWSALISHRREDFICGRLHWI